MKKIFTVIATYNSMEWIDKCLGSLNQSKVPIETVVVDNHSTDGTREKIESDYPNTVLIPLEANLGFAAANNTGIRYALKKKADFIFLLNHDAWINPDTISSLLSVSEDHLDCGILSPLHLNGSATGLDFLFSTYIIPEKCPGLISDIVTNQIKDYYPTKNVNAAAWFIKSKIFRKVGLFDEIFHLYGEDNNFVHRVRYFGFQIAITPFSKIYHDREKRSFKIKDENLTCTEQMNRMKVILLNPNLSLIDRWLLLFRKSFSDFIRNLRHLRIIRSFQNLSTFLLGIFYSFPLRNRHEKLKQEASKL